jgi:hypothetical protein
VATHDYVIANGSGAAVRSDLNGALAAIASNNSSATEPSPAYAYMWWSDTTTGLLKIRNAANTAWVTVGTLASTNLGLLASAGTLTAALGSASTPSVTFTGDLNTGIYSPGADQVAISTGGTGRVFVDASGNVFIGAAAAVANSRFLVAGVTGNNAFTVQGASSSSAALAFYNNAASTDRFAIGQGYASGSDNIAFIQNNANAALVLGTNSTERARIASTGELLVGTTTTTANGGKLQVSNGITFPATQVACSDANTLDDYEEGTWTPNQGSGLTVVGAFSSIGRYTKIGNMVTVWGQVGGATSIAVSAVGFITTNLPFTLQADLGATGTATGFWSSSNSAIHISIGVTNSIYSAQSISGVAAIGFTITYRS